MQNAPRPLPLSPLAVAAVSYALLPLVIFAIWWLTMGETPMIEHRQVRLVLGFQGLVLLLAALSGLSRRHFRGMLTRAETAALFGFLAVFIGSTLFVAVDPAAGFARGSLRGLAVLTGVALMFLASQAPRHGLDGISAALILQPLLHVPALAFLYFAYASPDTVMLNWLGGPPGFWHVRIWGMVLAAALAALIGSYAGRDAPGRGPQALVFALTALLAMLLAWSGSRGSIVGLGAGLVLMGLVFPRRTVRSAALVLPALLLGGALSLLLTPPLYAYGLVGGVAETLEAGTLNAASAGRLQMWGDALTLIAERPLFGYGHDQFVQVYTDGPLRALQPHNTLVSFLFDFGVVGGGCLAFLILSLWWRGTARVRRPGNGWKLSGFLVVATMAGASFFDGVLYHEIPILIVAMGFAILFAEPRAPRP